MPALAAIQVMSGVPRYRDGSPKVSWICGKCVGELGGGVDRTRCSTFHVGECGVCKRERVVTQPRDYVWTACPTGGNCE